MPAQKATGIRILGIKMEGNKVQFTLQFRGREMAHMDLGRKTFDRFIAEISTVANLDSRPRLEGNTVSAMLSPK